MLLRIGMKALLLICLGVALFLPRASHGSIEVTLLSAPEGPTSHTAIVAVNAYIQSSSLIDSVTAEIGELQLPLDRTSGSENNGNFVSTWARNFGLPPLPDGPTNLAITVHAASGETAVTNRTLIIASPPKLTVFAPFEDYVVHSGKRIPAKAIAYDEDSDVVITARAEYAVLGTNSIDTAFPITKSGTVTFRADGNHAQYTVQGFNFILQNNPKLEFVTDVPGTILDLDTNRVLYLRKGEQTVHINPIGVRSNSPAVYRPTNDWSIADGFLTSTGALLVERNTRTGSHRLFELNEANQIIDLGFASSARVQVEGNYAAWAVGGELLLRDFSSGTTITITNTLTGRTAHTFSLAQNGMVSFSEANTVRIHRYHSGTIEQVSTEPGYDNWTDGTNILFFEMDGFFPGRHPVHLYTPGGTVELGGNSFNRPALINNGWVAFHNLGVLWVRTPTGALQQRPAPGLWVLTEDGQILHNSTSKILTRPDGSSTDYGAFDGRPIYRNNRWEVILGNSLFRFRENFTNLMVVHQNGPILDLRFIGTPGDTYQFQITPDLEPPFTWSPHRTTMKADVNGSVGFLELAPPTNRFYRAIRIEP